MTQNELKDSEIKDFSRKVLLASSLIFLAAYITLFYGIHYPFSISFFQISISIIFFVSLFCIPYTSNHLVVALAPPFYYFFQLYFLTDIFTLEIFIPFYKDTDLVSTNGVDINRAIDSARQGTIYVWSFLLAHYLCRDVEIQKLFSNSFGILGAIILLLTLIAPRSNTNVLWFHTIPTLIDGWGSTVINNDLSAGFGFIWEFDIKDITIYYQVKQVSTTILGPFFNENNYVSFAGVIFPFITLFIVNRIKNKLTSSIIIIIISALTLYTFTILANSKGGFLAFIAAGLILIISRVYKKLSIILLSSCLLVSFLFSFFTAEYFGFITERFSGRFGLWKSTLDVIKSKPIFGVGPGNIQSQSIINEMNLPHLMNRQEWLQNYYTHNVYIEWVAENGLLGLGLLIFLFILFKQDLCNKKIISKFNITTFSICFFIFHSALDYSPMKPYTAFIFSLIVGLYYAKHYHPNNKQRNIKSFSLCIILVFFTSAAISITSIRFNLKENIIFNLENSMSSNFSSKYVYDGKPLLNKIEIEENLAIAEKYFWENRPDPTLAASIAKAHYLLSEGVDANEIIIANKWMENMSIITQTSKNFNPK